MSFVIGKGLILRGEVSGEGDLQVEGQIEGKVSLVGTVTIHEGAEVHADISATQIVVAGMVTGNLMASGRVEFRPTGCLVGNVRTKTLVVQEGGSVNGRLVVGIPPHLTGEVAEIEEVVRQEEARELWRSRAS
jgi:cytoskeletal protein CcmA (bactofilin family)